MLLCLLEMDNPSDRNKFMLLYQQYLNLMHYVIKGILNDEALAEDALQEAFFSIACNIEKIRDPDTPQTRSLCCIIARNKAIDILRKQHQELPTDWDVLQSVPAPGDGGLADALAALPQELRDILLLRYDSGYSATEIGKMMGLSTTQVRKRITKAKKHLRCVLKEEK